MKRFLRIILTKILPTVAVLALGIFIAKSLASSRPDPTIAPKTVQGILVEVMEAKPERQRIQVEAMGTVIPARELDLVPEVNGRIIKMNSNLVPGGYLRAGDEVARIDPRDYETAVTQAAAQLEQARLNLELERGRQIIAKREWTALYPTTQSSEASSSLALREPHLESAKANVESAESMLSQARLNLDRTIIRAPFNAIVRSEAVEIGQLIMPQTRIAKLIGADRCWVQVSIPVSQTPWIDLPDMKGDGGARATITLQGDENLAVEREGRIVRLLSDLDPDGRMARLLVAVDDPLGLESDKEKQTLPLLIGAYVHVGIDGQALDNVLVIPRTAIREGDRVWVMDEDDRLSVREVNIVWRRKDSVLLTNDIAPGERVVTSRIATPIPGMLLRTKETEAASRKNEPDETDRETNEMRNKEVDSNA